MGREKKSPGLKILWVWTIGTAAILVASVVRTRMHDMETMMNQEQAPPKQNQNVNAGHSCKFFLTDRHPDNICHRKCRIFDGHRVFQQKDLSESTVGP
ncbi:PREDICTED: uncharacterized protein LOC106323415 [Brassica oleracea var. oleracea]|uniref:uncharacterized protein LOC106323415 n=1 Tax=Brassica oleracea var. oleracea TaxID=109376 RepID=UPI0006A72D91|nr:PREDICTED: uncharacterized protein LOC106323415 [Brassica oleracea var. oleracea]